MAPAVNLPAGLTARPLTLDDVDPVVAMVNRCELADSGETMWERADLLADLAAHEVDLDRDWLGVFDSDRCVGWALFLLPWRAWVDVDPSVRGRGVGTALRTWTEDRARELGCTRVGQVIDDRRADVGEMLRAAGYAPVYASWILRMDHPEEPPSPVVPDGIVLRTFRPDEETELLTMFEDAFREFEGRMPSTIDAWLATTVHREGFRPEDMLVAAAGDRIVGGAFLIETEGSIWVDKFAVHRDYRHRGIARALLQTAFRRSYDLGSGFTELNTDSRTGALSFYERVGMHVRSSYTNWALDL
jgi:GNAT superfamily N-acetyltransferase